MIKLILIVSFMFIGTSLWASRLSCDSCGSECAPACGTRRFRSCCFNYLRKKRGPDNELWWTNIMDVKHENSPKPKLPYFNVDNIPDQVITNLNADEKKPYILDDDFDVRALA